MPSPRGSTIRRLGGHEEERLLRPQDGFIPIHMPKNTGAGFVIARCALLGLRAHLAHVAAAAVAFVAVLAAVIIHTFNYERDFHIPAEEVAHIEANARD